MRYKKQFYSRVIKDNPNTEIAKLLQDNDDCGYYEVCQSFVDAALNAPIIQNDDGSLSGVFQYSDMATVKQKQRHTSIQKQPNVYRRWNSRSWMLSGKAPRSTVAR